MKIQMLNVSEFETQLKNLANDSVLDSITTEALQTAGNLIAEQMRAIAPLDEGVLRASIKAKVRKQNKTKPKRVVIRPFVDYYAFVELGTIRQAPQPFLLSTFTLSNERATIVAKNIISARLIERGRR